MIKHVVTWKFRPGTEKQAEEFLAELNALVGQNRSIAVGGNRRKHKRKRRSERGFNRHVRQSRRPRNIQKRSEASRGGGDLQRNQAGTPCR